MDTSFTQRRHLPKKQREKRPSKHSCTDHRGQVSLLSKRIDESMRQKGYLQEIHRRESAILTPSASKTLRNTSVNGFGETALLSQHFDEMRKHIKATMAITENEEHTIAPNEHHRHDSIENAPWHISQRYELVDYYQILIMLVVLLPQLVVLHPILCLLLIPPVGLNYLYVKWMVPCEDREVEEAIGSCESIPRNTIAWKIHCVLEGIACLPAACIVLFSLAISREAMHLFGMIYLLLSDILYQFHQFDRGKSVTTDEPANLASDVRPWKQYQNNLQIIEPYQNGPFLLWYYTDIIAAAAGMIHRRGPFAFISSFSLMFIANPWIKYWMTGNIYLNRLGERYITQLGGWLEDMKQEEVERYFRGYIARAKWGDETKRRYISSLFFCPHFPYPPSGRRFAVGMEHSDVAALVHTTHFTRKEPVAFGGNGLSEFKPRCLSISAEVPVFRVVLWRNNPYHIYTGVVEASICKRHQALEHPMWLINSHNKLASHPSVLCSTGWIDKFFVGYIPYLDYFVRWCVK